jgi:hypothetical protein
MSVKNILMAAGTGNFLPLEFVGGSAFSNASTQTPSCSLTSLTGGVASAPSEGDVVVACISFKDSEENIKCTTAGYVRVACLYADDNNDTNLAVFYKVLTSADTTVAFDLGGITASRFAVHVWRNADPYRPVCIVRTSVLTNTAVPNSPAITTPVNQSVVVSIGANAGGTTTPLSNLTVPSGMENFFQVTSSSDSGIGIASYLQATAGSYDPAAFGGGSTNTANSAAAVTLCVWPNQGVRPPEFIASQNTRTSGTTMSINKPTSTQQGDLMIAFMCSDQNRTWTGATGWTEVADQGTSPSLRIAYRVAGSSEPSSYTFNLSSSANMVGAILTYRYATYDTIGAITVEAVDSDLINADVSPGINPWATTILFASKNTTLQNYTFDVNYFSTPRVLNPVIERVVNRAGTAPSLLIGDRPASLPNIALSNSTNSRLGVSYSGTGNYAAYALSIKPI